MWRLIVFIIILTVFLVFISFNLEVENRCDISFGFAKLSDVPVFITIFTSFILGFLCAFPLFMILKNRKNEKPEKDKKDKKPVKDSSNNPYGGGNAA